MSFKNVKCIAKVIAQKTMLCGDENKLKLKQYKYLMLPIHQ